jgi:hypothetical protein
VMENGYIRYKPGRMFRGNVTDSFVVTLSDGRGGTVEARITVRAFDTIAGTFQGLLVDAAPMPLAQPAQPSALPAYRGRLTATMNGRAAFSAKLELDGKVVRFTGTLTGALQATRKISIGGKAATATLNYNDLSDSWNITVLGSDFLVQGSGTVQRAVRSGRAQTAVFDVGMNPQMGSPWFASPGAATLTLRPTGVATMAGKLPDGTPFVIGARRVAGVGLPLYRWLGAATATDVPVLGGALQFTGAANDLVGGNVVWRHGALSGGSAELLGAEGSLK